jgi:hypothetical protein
VILQEYAAVEDTPDAADILDVLGDLAGRARRRALERHVLDEVAEPVLLGPLGEDAEVALDVLGDILTRSVFEAGELAREKGVILQVPLNAMCSMRWLSPCSSGRSLREPAPTQTPRVAVRHQRRADELHRPGTGRGRRGRPRRARRHPDPLGPCP